MELLINALVKVGIFKEDCSFLYDISTKSNFVLEESFRKLISDLKVFRKVNSKVGVLPVDTQMESRRMEQVITSFLIELGMSEEDLFNLDSIRFFNINVLD